MSNNLLNEFNPKLDLDEASTAPASWYTNEDFYKEECNTVLKKSWQFVAPVDFFSESGSFYSGELLGEPFVVLKDREGQIRAFYNVCRHHAACLVEGKGTLSSLTCPYHGWTYSLSGELLKAPHLGPIKNFDKSQMKLVEIPLKILGPFVMINFSKSPDSSFEKWAPIFSKLNDSGYQDLKFVHRREYEIKCNWKVYVDNYLDGGYHVGVLHKNLAGQLDLKDYKIENFDKWTLQSCRGSDADSIGVDFKERIGDGAFYAWLFPNFMINRYGPMMDTNWVMPVGHDRCIVVFDYYFKDPSDQKFVESSLRASDLVQKEDTYICESVQRGLSSSAYHAGRYARSESGMFLFHKWLHDALSHS